MANSGDAVCALERLALRASPREHKAWARGAEAERGHFITGGATAVSASASMRHLAQMRLA